MRAATLEDTNRKRPAPSEPTDGLDDAKRQRLDAEVPSDSTKPTHIPLPASGPVSYAQLYTLVADPTLLGISVGDLPVDLLCRYIVLLMKRIDDKHFDDAINAVRARYLSLSSIKTATPLQNAESVTGISPPSHPLSEAQQLVNELDAGTMLAPISESLALKPFRIPQPQPFSADEVGEYGKDAVNRVFSTVTVIEENVATAGGATMVLALQDTRTSWATLVSRLATRALLFVGTPDSKVKIEGSTSMVRHSGTFSVADAIRETLLRHIVDEFRTRMDIAITWLNEEWASRPSTVRKFSWRSRWAELREMVLEGARSPSAISRPQGSPIDSLPLGDSSHHHRDLGSGEEAGS
ncbi:hypothetical protein MRB53_037161 [Persea americana]|nr:hypothetical protein MRB53_037161 [Persea americana]